MGEKFLFGKFCEGFLKFEASLVAFMAALCIPLYLAANVNAWFVVLVFVFPATVAGLTEALSAASKTLDEVIVVDDEIMTEDSEDDNK